MKKICKQCEQNKQHKALGLCQQCYYKIYNHKYRQNLKQNDPKKYNDYKNSWRNGGDKVQKIVFDKFDNKCAECHDDYDLVIHHLDNNGRSKFSDKLNNNIENLVLLCRSCHAYIHNESKK
jgi:hypothetical protein